MNAEILAAIEERLRRLGQQAPQCPVKKLQAGQPTMFSGSRDDQELAEWLSNKCKAGGG
jgi:hypothetical protein